MPVDDDAADEDVMEEVVMDEEVAAEAERFNDSVRAL